jgi:hypothetical protein
VSPSTVRRDGERPVVNSYARFDLSALPPSPTVQKAVLRLWVSAVVMPGAIEVVPVLSPWQEHSIIFDKAPGLGTPVASVKVNSSQVLHFVNVDITGLVKDWASGVLDNHGLALRGREAETVHLSFDTKENRRRGGGHARSWKWCWVPGVRVTTATSSVAIRGRPARSARECALPARGPARTARSALVSARSIRTAISITSPIPMVEASTTTATE